MQYIPKKPSIFDILNVISIDIFIQDCKFRSAVVLLLIMFPFLVRVFWLVACCHTAVAVVLRPQSCDTVGRPISAILPENTTAAGHACKYSARTIRDYLYGGNPLAPGG